MLMQITVKKQIMQKEASIPWSITPECQHNFKNCKYHCKVHAKSSLINNASFVTRVWYLRGCSAGAQGVLNSNMLIKIKWLKEPRIPSAMEITKSFLIVQSGPTPRSRLMVYGFVHRSSYQPSKQIRTR